MKFYTYSQNNSGGTFCNPAKYVIVEAPSAHVANAIAEDNGLYFNGCQTGQDCPCCGDRWYKAWEDDATDEPEIYGKAAESFVPDYDMDPEVPLLLIVRLNDQ